jgi:NADPH-dependent glutamate synthase beta subunit-like oxidoreductase
LLATGAWKDRPLALEGIDRYINKGFYYQNPFVSWFNRNHDPKYDDPNYKVSDDAIIVGGGLASIDVAKIIMIETFRKALEKKGEFVNVLEIEKRGIPAILDDYKLTFNELQLIGCTLYYRRQLTDMPLSILPENPSAKDIETAHRVRQKIMDNVQKKFLFRFAGCHQPVRIISDKDTLKGLVFERTEIREGRVSVISNSEYDVISPLVISAIGSLPEPIADLPYSGQSFEIEDQETGQIKGFDNVFALGNAVTGRGNIRESQLHGRRVSEQVIDEFLAWQPEDYQEIFDRAVVNADRKVEKLSNQLQMRPLLSKERVKEILERVENIRRKVGFDGDYKSWINKNIPVRLENIAE